MFTSFLSSIPSLHIYAVCGKASSHTYSTKCRMASFLNWGKSKEPNPKCLKVSQDMCVLRELTWMLFFHGRGCWSDFLSKPDWFIHGFIEKACNQFQGVFCPGLLIGLVIFSERGWQFALRHMFTWNTVCVAQIILAVGLWLLRSLHSACLSLFECFGLTHLNRCVSECVSIFFRLEIKHVDHWHSLLAMTCLLCIHFLSFCVHFVKWFYRFDL